MGSSFENWAFLAVAVIAAVALAFLVFRIVKRYAGAGGSGSAPGDLKAYDDKEASKVGYGTLRTYSLRVAHTAIESLKRAGVSPPVFQDTAYVSCADAASADAVSAGAVVQAEHRSATWLPLTPSRDALQLHYDVAGGSVNHVILTGAVLRVWALPPSQEARGAVMFAVSLPEDVSFPDADKDDAGAGRGSAASCKRLQLLPVLQPFRAWAATDAAAASAALSVRANVRNAIAHSSAPLLQVWAF